MYSTVMWHPGAFCIGDWEAQLQLLLHSLHGGQGGVIKTIDTTLALVWLTVPVCGGGESGGWARAGVTLTVGRHWVM